jgi:hypothetical protein
VSRIRIQGLCEFTADKARYLYSQKCGPRNDTYDIYIHIDESHRKSTMNKPTANSLFGFNAGVVWKALNQNGPSNIRSLVKATSLSREEINGALGWLGREDKIVIEQKGRAIVFSLRNEELRLSVHREIAIEKPEPKKKPKPRKSKQPKKARKARSIKAPAKQTESPAIQSERVEEFLLH